MAEGSSGAAPTPAPPCRLRGPTSSAPARRCCGGCGLALARLVRRLRRRGRRALRAATASQPQPQRRRGACQYDPLSYARNFDADADDARGYYGCSFSSRFVRVPASSSSATVVSTGAAPVQHSRPAATS